MRRLILLIVVVFSGCTGQSPPSHYNHLRLNAPLDSQSRIEYRDLTRSFAIVDTGPFVSREPISEPVPLLAAEPAILEDAGEGAVPVTELLPSLELIEAPAPQHFCRDEFVFEIGMLRQNLSEALLSCGYVLGEWAIGDDDYLIDFPVRGRFTVPITVGIEDVLQVVKKQFGLSAAVNEVTRSVDFYRTPVGEGV